MYQLELVSLSVYCEVICPTVPNMEMVDGK